MGQERSTKKEKYSEATKATNGASPSCTPSDAETTLLRNLQQHTHIPLLLLTPTLSNIASTHEDTAALALKSLGYTLHHENILAAFSDECAQTVLSSLLKVITKTTLKSLCRLGVWCLGVQEFGVPLLETQLDQIVQAIVHAIDNPMDSKAVTYEALQAVVKMVHKVPKIRLAASLWAPPVYKKLLSPDKKDRDMAERCLKDMESWLLPPMPSLSQVVAVDISQTLLCMMEKMVRSRAFVVPTIRAWSWLLRLLGSKAGENRKLVNQMLKVAEVTFTNQDSQVQIASLVAWEALIDALIQEDDDLQKQMDTVSPSARTTLKPYASPSVKRLKLLMTPLLTIMRGESVQSVRLACWRTWTYLAHKLDFAINDLPVQAAVVIPMFQSVFNAGPERGSSGVWDLCLNSLEAWVSCKLQDKLDARSVRVLSIGLEGGVSSPKTPSQTRSTETEVEVLPIKWSSWSMETLETILKLVKVLWLSGVKDLKQFSDNLILNGAIRLLLLVIKGVDGEGKGAVKPSKENVTSVHAVLRFVSDLSVEFELLTGVEEPVSTLWPAFEVLMEFGHLVLSSSFYKLPFTPPSSQLSNGHFSFHLSPSDTITAAEALPISENLVTPIAYTMGMWIQVGCSVLCKSKEETKVLQKLEKLAECTKSSHGIMMNLQGMGFILDRLLFDVFHKQGSAGIKEDRLTTDLELWDKDFYFLQVWRIFAWRLASYIERSNDVPAVESYIQDSGYQVVHKFLLLPLQLSLNPINVPLNFGTVLQDGSSHKHAKCMELMQSSNELDFVVVAWTKLYDCCLRVSSLKSSQPNVFGSTFCRKVSRLLETHECCLDQGGKQDGLSENPLLQDMLGFIAKHILRQTDISSFAMLAINRKKRLGSFVGGSYLGNGVLGNDVEDTSNIRDTLCLASRLLDLAWNKRTTGKTCWLGVTSRVLSALAGLVTRLYSQQDCVILLQDISRPLAKWLSYSDSNIMKHKACPSSEVLQQDLQDLWEKLLTLLQKCQPPLSYNSNLLSLQSPLLVPAFQHRKTSISNSTLSFWESTYGCTVSGLKYAPCLVPVLQQLSEKVKISLPGWERNMASEEGSSEMGSEMPTGGRKQLHLLQEESLMRKRSKQAYSGFSSEVEGMLLPKSPHPSNFCQNARLKTMGKPLDALLEKIKRPVCISNALSGTNNSENPVCKSITALVRTSMEPLKGMNSKDSLVDHGVKNANQNSEIKQEGAACRASQALHQNKEPLQKLASNLNSADVSDLPCDNSSAKTREQQILPSRSTLCLDCKTSLQRLEGDVVPASEWDSGASARRKKLRFLEDENLQYATIPLTQKKAGPLTDHQKEVRLAQSGTLGSECTSHGAGVKTYTTVDFSQSQIVLDSEDPEDFSLEIPVEVLNKDDDELHGLASSMILVEPEPKNSYQSAVLTDFHTNKSRGDGLVLSAPEKGSNHLKDAPELETSPPDNHLKLPSNALVAKEMKPCAGDSTKHIVMHKASLQRESKQLQPDSIGGFDTVTPSKVLRSGRKLMKCPRATCSDKCREFHDGAHPATECSKDWPAKAMATLSKSCEMEDLNTTSYISDQTILGSGSSQAKCGLELPKSQLVYQQPGLTMDNRQPGLLHSKCCKESQFVPSPENRRTEETGDKKMQLEPCERMAPKMSNPKYSQAASDPKNPANCASGASSILDDLEQEALHGQTQLLTQPCDTQLLLESGSAGYSLAPTNRAVCDLLSAASSSGQWISMDMQSLDCAQRLLDSIGKKVQERKLILLAGDSL